MIGISKGTLQVQVDGGVQRIYNLIDPEQEGIDIIARPGSNVINIKYELVQQEVELLEAQLRDSPFIRIVGNFPDHKIHEELESDYDNGNGNGHSSSNGNGNGHSSRMDMAMEMETGIVVTMVMKMTTDIVAATYTVMGIVMVMAIMVVKTLSRDIIILNSMLLLLQTSIQGFSRDINNRFKKVIQDYKLNKMLTKNFTLSPLNT